MTRTIEVPIPDDLLKLVDKKAKQTGLKREDYIRAVLSREVSAPPSLSEILAPFREEVAASGMSEEELARLFSAAREESPHARRPEIAAPYGGGGSTGPRASAPPNCG